ncbi:MAG TPA: response regulator [Methylomirabilota bacterium]|nr:response regulator [Methylomirabilota bacterium]
MPKLLVVDDDEALRRLMGLELSDKYEVITTGEPEQGLALALEHRPDAILLDLRMPKYSGYELCQTFTTFSRTQTIPVVIVSGEGGSETKEYCRQLGAAGYFEKPVDFEELKGFLARIAKERRFTPRSEVRVRLRVSLKLSGKDAAGRNFQVAATSENVSLSGFLCVCSQEIALHSVVEVFMTTWRDDYVGKAEIMHTDQKQAPNFRYGCRFVEKTGPWVLQ